MIWLYIGICLLILIIEAPPLIRRGQHKELGVFMLFLAIGLLLGLSFFLKWPIIAMFEALTLMFDKSI
jgi:hypothetical protein